MWWREGGPTYGMTMFVFGTKLKYIKNHLKRWNTSWFGNLQSRKRNALNHLTVITHQIRDSGLTKALGRVESKAMWDVGRMRTLRRDLLEAKGSY